eukprot:COSAG01_NODE_60040_length_296_cov_4.690355_1_plen_25_part_01
MRLAKATLGQVRAFLTPLKFAQLAK